MARFNRKNPIRGFRSFGEIIDGSKRFLAFKKRRKKRKRKNHPKRVVKRGLAL